VSSVVERFYRPQHAGWMGKIRPRERFVSDLRTAALDTARAQFEMPNAVNPPIFHPERKVVETAHLPGLEFLASQFLCLALKDAWNDKLGLFSYDDRYYLVDWSTFA
jgi:hypothetical protein